MPAAPTPPAAEVPNWVLIRRLLGLAWRYRLRCIQVVAIQLILQAMLLAGLGLTGAGIDFVRRRVAGGAPAASAAAPTGLAGLLDRRLPAAWPPVADLALLAGIILLIAAVRAVLNYQYQVQVNKLVQQNLVVDLRAEVYDKLQRLSFRFFDANTTGSIITRVTSDVQNVRMFVDQVVIQALIMAVAVVGNGIYMASLSPGLTAACLGTTPILWILAARFSRSIQPEITRNRTLVERMVQRLSESVQGIAVTRGFGRDREDRARFDEANRAVFDQQTSIFWRMSLFSPTVTFLTRINTMVLLGYGGWLVIHGRLPLGAGLVVFAGLLDQFSAQVNNVATIVNSIQQSLVGARRVFEILDAPVEVDSPPDPVAPARLRGAVRMEGVSFKYGPADPVLHDIDLEVEPGRCVAILGATGAGKSALMSLIPRFYDVTAGRILIDGIDVRRMQVDRLRRSIGIVFQESFLFSNTVAANIAFGHPEATQAQIEKAARIAAAHEFILTLPLGYDTVLGENGVGLSGGQRQRLALARAILLEPAILLLDDPTAAVDSETEHEIFDALDRAIRGRTTFIVAHRLSTLRRADFIVVMEDGRIVQRGTHAELMRVPGPYLRVADLQLVDADGLGDGNAEGGRA